MDWDADLDEAALAEIERLEQEALRREAARTAPAPAPPPIIRQAAPKLPSPQTKSVTKQLTATSFAPPYRPAGPSPSTSPTSSVARSPPSQPNTAYRNPNPISNPIFPRPLPAPSLLPAEPLDELEEPAPGNTSVQPAPSSSPSRYTLPPSHHTGASMPVPPLMPQGPARKMYSGKCDTAATSANRTPLPVDVALHSRERVAVRIPSGWNLDVQRTAKGFPGAAEERDKSISLPIEHYHQLVDALRRIPDLSLRLLYPAAYDLYVAKKQVPQPHPPPLDTLLPSDLNQTLLPFQREGVEFALRRDGRVLIGDEMGLGKTLQAIAIAVCYRKEWPLLVICPASVKLQWAEHLEKYVPGLLEEDINLVLSGKKGHLNSLINIVSYDLCPKMAEHFSRRTFNVIICDESHFLKTYNSKRTLTIVPLIQRARRAVLLSGTPAISRPKELWQQISAIDTPLFGSPKQPWSFYDRYCNAHRDRFGKINSDGASNLTELHLLMQDTVMIRRLKADVMKHLPPKRRTEVRVEIAKKVSDAMKRIQAEKELARMKLDAASGWGDEAIDAQVESRGLLMELYKDTGTAKIPAIVEYVSDLCESDQKFLVFAYHLDVLDALEHEMTKKKVEFIRIDGKTPGHHRGQLTANFQSNANIRVALLGITAAGVGLTLHAASTVVFAELYWNPGALLQAEDRAHRYGTQAESVNIYYIIGKKTIDESIWSMISKKLSVVGSTLNGTEQKMNIEKTEKKAANQAVVDEYLGTLMGEIDTFDERQEAFRQRRTDRKEVRQYLKGAPLGDADDCADDDIIIEEDGGAELDSAPATRPKRKITDDGADDNQLADQPPDASHATKSARGDPAIENSTSPAAPPAKPLSSNIHMYSFSRPGAKSAAPPAPPAAAVATAAASAQSVTSVAPRNSTSPAPSPAPAPAPAPVGAATSGTPLSAKISMFSFVRPGAAPPAPTQPKVEAVAVKAEPREDQDADQGAAEEEAHATEAAEVDAGADATLTFVRPKRNRFIADDE